MKDQPFFSVVIPTLNRSHILGNVLDVLLNEEYKAFEVIIVDDGSADGTDNFVQSYLSDVRFIYHFQENKGVSAARNKGVSLAKGKYLIFLDSDDIPAPTILTDFFNRLKEKENCLLLFSLMNQKGIVKGLKPNDYLFKKPISVIPGTYCVERNIFIAVGGFDEDLSHSENWELIIRLGHHPKVQTANIESLNKVTLFYSAQYSKEKLLFNKKNKIKSYSALYQKHKIRSVYPTKLVAFFAQVTANNYAGLGNFIGTLTWTFKSVQTAPLTFKNYYKPIIIFFKRRIIPYNEN